MMGIGQKAHIRIMESRCDAFRAKQFSVFVRLIFGWLVLCRSSSTFLALSTLHLTRHSSVFAHGRSTHSLDCIMNAWGILYL
jgi:hypothetical protein